MSNFTKTLAVTVGILVAGQISVIRGILYILVQCAGGILGAAGVLVRFCPSKTKVQLHPLLTFTLICINSWSPTHHTILARAWEPTHFNPASLLAVDFWSNLSWPSSWCWPSLGAVTLSEMMSKVRFHWRLVWLLEWLTCFRWVQDSALSSLWVG